MNNRFTSTVEADTCFPVRYVKEVTRRVATCLGDIFARALEFKSVGAVVLGDDMGYKTGTMMSPDIMRKYIIPYQKMLADIAHSKNVPFVLHSCGNLQAIMDDIIDDIKVDAKALVRGYLPSDRGGQEALRA
jgi:uroporphyrinogen decarboxylase